MHTMQYLDTPEARTAILRVSMVAAITAVCVVGAARTHRRWARIVLGVAGFLLAIFVLWGVFVISLIIQYGPR